MLDPRLPKEFVEALRAPIQAAMHAAPFFGYMLMGPGVYIRHTTSPRVNIAATDGFYIYVTERWVNEYDIPGRAFILLHENVHVWFNHSGRGALKDPKIWGEAIDLFTNTFVEHACTGFHLKTPPDGLQPDDRYIKMTVEEIYKELLEKQAKNGSSASAPRSGSGKPDPLANDVLPDLKAESEKDGYDNTGRTDERDMRKLRVATATAEQMMKHIPLPGPIGNLIRARIADVLAPTVDWGRKLRKDVSIAIGAEYETWERPDPYYPNLVVPTMYGGKSKRIDYFVDVSGSMVQAWLNRVSAELLPLLEKCEEFWVHTFDAKVRSSVQIKNPSELRDYKFPTGSHCHTAIEPVVEVIDSIPNTIPIVGTDGYFSCPEKPVKGLHWVIPEEASTSKPWGTVHELPKPRF